MSAVVFASARRQSFRISRISLVRIVRVNRLSTKTRKTTGSVFERIAKEELTPIIGSRLRDREFLPGSTGGGFPEFLAGPSDSFPHGVRVNTRDKASLPELSEKCMDYVKENLVYSPAILFRGLPAETADDFLTITQAIPGKAMSYAGGGVPRPEVLQKSGIYYTSTEDEVYSIDLHHEMAYGKSYPSKLFFFCVQEPADGCGGETPLVKSSDILSDLDPEVVRKFKEKGVKYARYLPDKSSSNYMTWQQQYYTNNREEAETIARSLFDNVYWDDKDNMYWSHVNPAFHPHPKTGEKIWFNQATTHHRTYYKSLPSFTGTDIPDDKYPTNTYYGDGSEIEPEVIQHLRAVSWSCAVGFRWRKGDLLVLDNMAVRHGRIGFKGEREILLHMTADT